MNIRVQKPKTPSNNFSHNSKFVISIVIIFAVLLVIMMTRWQIIEHEKWDTFAKSQYVDTQRKTTSRGIVYASDGTVLAIDKPVWGVYASLSVHEKEREEFFKNKSEYVEQVAAILGTSNDNIEKSLTPEFRYVKLASGVSADKKKALEQVKISSIYSAGFGLSFEKEELRDYPNNNLASHVLGFMGKNSKGEDVGMYGIEGYYFSDLLSSTGYSYEEKDSKGNVILTSEYSPVLPREGKSIKLTIVPAVQTKVESILKKQVEAQQAKSGSAIIMDPKTGAILAMANYPDYNPNQYWKISDPWIFKNKAVGDVYEFGSVMKPVTLAIGLESGNVKEDFICKDSKGFIEFPGLGPNGSNVKIYTWNRLPSGNLTMAGILEKSNNPCAAQVALNTGFQYYFPKLQEFGFGSYIGVGLQDEATSYLQKYESWTKIDLAVTSFGQSISATPLQILSAMSTIANDGKRMKPYIVSEIEDNEGVIKYSPQILAEPISKDTADKVSKMMVSVVRNGDPSYEFNRRLSNYSVAGKTGTAQIPKENEVGYYKDKTNTTFIGFAPAEDAKMIMIVKIQEPKSSTLAAYTAVPTWIDIFKAVASDLEIPTK